jgi:hypothetical protein
MPLTLSCNVNNNLPGVMDNDIYLNSIGNISLSTSIQAILENCAQAAKTRLGEEVLHIDQGIPYFTTIFVGVPSLEQAQAAFRAAWLAVAGVIEVLSLEFTQQDNILFYAAIIRTTEGIGELNAGI